MEQKLPLKLLLTLLTTERINKYYNLKYIYEEEEKKQKKWGR